jgi:hypothetical protein
MPEVSMPVPAMPAAQRFSATGYAGFRRHQDLEVGGVKVAQSRQIRFGGGSRLEPFKQPFRFFHAYLVTKYGAVLLEFDWHQTISRMLRIMSTDPSPMSAEPE